MAPLQVSQKNDSEASLIIWQRLLVSENDQCRVELFNAFQWVLRILRQDGAFSNSKGTFSLGKAGQEAYAGMLTVDMICVLHMFCKPLAYGMGFYNIQNLLFCHAKLVSTPGVRKSCADILIAILRSPLSYYHRDCHCSLLVIYHEQGHQF